MQFLPWASDDYAFALQDLFRKELNIEMRQMQASSFSKEKGTVGPGIYHVKCNNERPQKMRKFFGPIPTGVFHTYAYLKDNYFKSQWNSLFLWVRQKSYVILIRFLESGWHIFQDRVSFSTWELGTNLVISCSLLSFSSPLSSIVRTSWRKWCPLFR